MSTYMPRIVDAELIRRLTRSGAVVIEGPKACGKTETAKQQAHSSVVLDVDQNARQAAQIDPSLVLEGDSPRLLDEWQTVPELWNHVRRAVDDRQLTGQFILTGSSVPADDANRHTGAGRFSFLRMRPMSTFETGHSTGEVSLAALMRGEPARAPDSGDTVTDIARRIAVGGWPALQTLDTDLAQPAIVDYLRQISEVDVGRIAGPRRDPIRIARLITSLARNTATEVAVTTLAADAAGDDTTLDRTTVREYLDALERLMVIEDQPAWAPHLRSRRQLRSSPKRHFVDPSLAAAALRAGPDRLLGDLNFFGLLFESTVIRDLRVYAQPLDGTVLHYRDNKGTEVDAIVELPNGSWAAFEVKLGAGAVEEGAASLVAFRDLVDTDRRGQPAALAVITVGGYAYTRDDGVSVVPISTFGP